MSGDLCFNSVMSDIKSNQDRGYDTVFKLILPKMRG